MAVLLAVGSRSGSEEVSSDAHVAEDPVARERRIRRVHVAAVATRGEDPGERAVECFEHIIS